MLQVLSHPDTLEAPMSAIIDSLRKRPDFERGDFAGTRRNTDRTPVGEVGLREIARQQGEALRGAFGGPKPLAPRAAAAVERVNEHRARATTPSAATRRGPVEDIRDVQPNPDGSTPRVPYALLDKAAAKIGQGYFALARRNPSGAGNTLTFFAIMPMRGKDGVMRIRQLLGGPGGWQYRNLSVNEQFHALRHIVADVETARNLFADKTERCWRCKSPLTNERSRRLRIGPECETKV